MGYYDDYLEHHGILGQKWGVRRFENAQGHLTAAGKKRYADGRKVTAKEQNAESTGKTKAKGSNVESTGKKESSGEETKEKKGFTPEQKKKLMIAGAAVVGTAVAAYGGYKLYQLNTKATEGLSKDFHNKALEAHKNARWLNSMGDMENEHGLDIARTTGHDSANKLMDLGASYWHEGSYQKNLANQYDYRALNKNFSVKDKYNYLKGRKIDDDSVTQGLKKAIDKEQSRRSGLKIAADASTKALETAKSAQNTHKTIKADSSKVFNQKTSLQFQANRQPNSIEKAASKAAYKASVSLSKKLTPPGAKTINNGQKTINTVTKISGQTKFNQAAKANDDLVNELLKRNAKALGR